MISPSGWFGVSVHFSSLGSAGILPALPASVHFRHGFRSAMRYATVSCRTAAPSLTLLRWGREPGSSPQRGEAGRGAERSERWSPQPSTRLAPHTDGMNILPGRASPSQTLPPVGGYGETGFPHTPRRRRTFTLDAFAFPYDVWYTHKGAAVVAPSSSGLGRHPLKVEIAGSNPAGVTRGTRGVAVNMQPCQG